MKDYLRDASLSLFIQYAHNVHVHNLQLFSFLNPASDSCKYPELL